ncbi:MAG: hypothetical protein GY832_30955 [Chloroflexi bacterium]|nr:hypothetical protein [Chloroflexota bacterium]
MTGLPYLIATNNPKYKPRLTVSGDVWAALGKFKNLMILAGGLATGALVSNSDFRPKGETCGKDKRGKTDATDINGHHSRRAIDFSATRTAESFFGKNCAPEKRNAVRDNLFKAGFRFPWYWKNGRIHEHWHIALEIDPWTQKNAYRECPPHWRY